MTNKLLISIIVAGLAVAHGSRHGVPRANDFRVKGLDIVEPAFRDLMEEGGYDMFAGLLPARDDLDSDDDASLFFWLFFNENATNKDSLVIWFNGGPGCSSLDAGLLFEMGPVTTPLHRAGYDNTKEGKTAPLQVNKYAWLHSANIMYVEQPVGVGYSNPGKDGPPQNEDEVAADFYQFMQNFYRVFPRLHSQRLYLIGESYAGMYVPSMAHYIAKQNKHLDGQDVKIPLSGIALGNGWVDVIRQGPMVIDYAWWHGMIDTVARDALWNVWDECMRDRKNDQHMREPFHDFTVPDECGIMPQLMKAAGGDEARSPNIYDVTTWDRYAVLTSEDGTFAQFYNNPYVKEALNVGHVKKDWMGCLPGAGRRRLLGEPVEEGNTQPRPQVRRHLGPLLDNDTPVSMSKYIADILDDDEADIDVLVYNGDDDLSTCSQGSEVFLNDMKWSGQQDWLDPNSYERGLWKVKDKVAGHAKSVKNLHFLIVYNSGHMVPYNQPVHALDLVTRLTSRNETNYVDQDIELSFLTDYLPVLSNRSYDFKYSSNGGHSSSAWTSNLVSALIGVVAGVGLMWVKSSFGNKRRGYESV